MMEIANPSKLKDLSPTDLKRLFEAKVRERVIQDPYFWLTNFVWTFNPDNTDDPKQRFQNKEYIKKWVEYWLKERILLVPKSPQHFATWTFVALHGWDAMYHAGRFGFFQSSKESKAGFGSPDMEGSDQKGSPLTLLGRLWFIWDKLPNFLKTPCVVGREPPIMKFMHGDTPSIIQGISSAGDEIRQYTVTNYLGDEIAFQSEAAETFLAVMPRLTRSGHATLVSTANHHEFFHAKVFDLL